ncbi:hypothetical protein AB0Q95_15465 [Streptomyces sp. NPDC059900]|uniref:hypothetical protein n=1 Tax=Streptomyces sp. NPDC059900 TaxID=3155816 RepID=UPI003421845D
MAVMEHSAAAHHWVTEAAGLAAKEQGAGNLLRIVLIVMVVGCVLVAWFLLRGYRQGADAGRSADGAERSADAAGRSADGTEPSADGAEAGGSRPGGSGVDDRADRNG